MTRDLALAFSLRRAYNPRITSDAWIYASERNRWRAVARAVLEQAVPAEPEQLAAKLHAVYVADIDVQRQRGWPPLAESERLRWLAVARVAASAAASPETEEAAPSA